MASEIYLLIGLLFVTAIFNTGEAKRCYSCMGVSSLGGCSTVANCSTSAMKCYATKYLRESDSQIAYDFQCRDASACATRRKRDIPLWQSCCEGEYCNKNFDDAGIILDPQYHRRHCYSCAAVADPFFCYTTMECNSTQACYTVDATENASGQLFTMGCFPIDACISAGHHLPYGKRATNCRACCNTRENCNNQFCSRQLGITGETPMGPSVAPITTSTMSTESTTVSTTTPATTTPQYTYNTVVSPSTYTGSFGQEADFNCTFNHDDPTLSSIRMVWTFSGAPGQTIYNQTITDLSRILTIHDLEQSDVGTYTCDVYYQGNRYSDTGNLSL